MTKFRDGKSHFRNSETHSRGLKNSHFGYILHTFALFTSSSDIDSCKSIISMEIWSKEVKKHSQIVKTELCMAKLHFKITKTHFQNAKTHFGKAKTHFGGNLL